MFPSLCIDHGSTPSTNVIHDSFHNLPFTTRDESAFYHTWRTFFITSARAVNYIWSVYLEIYPPIGRESGIQNFTNNYQCRELPPTLPLHRYLQELIRFEPIWQTQDSWAHVELSQFRNRIRPHFLQHCHFHTDLHPISLKTNASKTRASKPNALSPPLIRIPFLPHANRSCTITSFR